MENKLKIGLGAIHKLKYKLNITPGLKQRLHILQLPVLELGEYLNQQIQENPLLETGQEKIDFSFEETKPAQEEKQPSADEDTVEYFQKGSFASTEDKGDQEKKAYKETLITKKPTLEEYLLRQLHLLKLSPQEYRIGEYIIDSLDENGYLQTPLQEIATNLGVTIQAAERLLTLIQGFEPPGIGARNFQQCLKIQLKAKGKADSLAAKIVQEYLIEFSKKKYKALAKKLKISRELFNQAKDEIYKLEPKPGRFFSNRETEIVTPDIILKAAGAGYEIELNDQPLPTLKISKNYLKMLKDKKAPEKTRKFLKQKLHGALWIIKAIEQRQKTIRKITNCILLVQRQAIDQGLSNLKPLTLKEIARITGMHPSTVSRAIQNKYMQTPYEVYGLKEFLSGELESEIGELISAEKIKATIKDLVARENKAAALSDDQILKALKQAGIKLSRRTVAKYRSQLKIPPAYLRYQ